MWRSGNLTRNPSGSEPGAAPRNVVQLDVVRVQTEVCAEALRDIRPTGTAAEVSRTVPAEMLLENVAGAMNPGPDVDGAANSCTRRRV